MVARILNHQKKIMGRDGNRHLRQESKMDEQVYDIVCDLCESTCEVIVDENTGAIPEFCPMCGTPVEPQ